MMTMNKVYLDNAATTQLREEVIDEMAKVLREDFGNPSSSHAFGRQAKSILELARKSIAKNLNCSAQEIIFTSGGTEADNLVLRSAVSSLKVKRIITSKIEHHAVLHTVELLSREHSLQLDYVKVKPSGDVDLDSLAELLAENIPTLVSLMHVNNEIGSVLDLERTGRLCREHNAYFHSDTVQSIGKVSFDLQNIPIDFIAASAHKFHGPKGIGFAYIRKGLSAGAMITGGEQEKGIRAGTESVHNIAGMARALEISLASLDQEREYVTDLKQYASERIKSEFPEAKLNGQCSFYNLLNVCFPFSEAKTAMILFHLDMKGIAVSRGSACQSGSAKPSHVLAEILSEQDINKPSLRISFSHFNDKADVDQLIKVLKSVS